MEQGRASSTPRSPQGSSGRQLHSDAASPLHRPSTRSLPPNERCLLLLEGPDHLPSQPEGRGVQEATPGQSGVPSSTNLTGEG